jgi:SNF2 family DNA or RNA helicase
MPAELLLMNGGRRVEVRLGDATGPRRRELEHTLMLHGALPWGGSFVMPTLAFRREAVQIARLLSSLDDDVVIQPDVEALLRVHLEEIQERRRAEAAELPALSADEVVEMVSASGRFAHADQLTERQVDNLAVLLALRHGANFSVPGAGKTRTLLALYEAVRQRDDIDRLLVVAPKNAFISWDDEVGECFDEGQVPLVQRLARGRAGVGAALLDDPEIALITYQLLPNVLDLVQTWGHRHRLHVALDESHRVKAGFSGVTAAAALDLSGTARRRDILSGTPLPHAPEDLRPQFEFLWPGQRILPDFRVVAEAPQETLEEVRHAVERLYVRTTKDQLELPPFDLFPVPVDLGPLQRELYDVLREDAARVASGMRLRDREFFRLLGRHVVRLLQAASNPMLLTQGALVDDDELETPPEGARAWDLLRELARYEQPVKVRAVVERAAELASDGHKVLIWTSFTMNVRALEDLLRDFGPVVLYGAVPTGDEDDPETREGRIHRFHRDPDCRVMIANPAAAGEGISLHRACHHAIYLDRTFNAAHYLQSVDRIHRLGLEPGTSTTIEIVEARDTIDRRVADRLRSKIEAMSLILNDPGLTALAYDPEDVIEDFGAGIEPDDLDEILDHLTHDSDDE